jgi:multiple antibiotic resistance protein
VNTALFGEFTLTLLVIMDPPGAVPVFLAVTRSMSAGQRTRAARTAVIAAFAVIVVFAAVGEQVLSYLKVSVPALQAAGGLLLLLVAAQLMLGTDGPQRHGEPTDSLSIAMVPLATPLLAGPGAIATTILFARQTDAVRDVTAIGAGIAAVHIVLWVALRFAGVLRRLIRDTGVMLLSRVAGVVLAAIAVQLIADGVIGFVSAAS